MTNGTVQVGRIEAFSDAVFALSATLLVVTLETPDSIDTLKDSLGGFVAFGFSFAVLVLIGSHHHKFFSDFGVRDGFTVILNSVLLFVVLLFVYPLKFLALSLTNWLFGIGPDMIGGPRDLQLMFVIYGAGWTAVFASFAALHGHVWRQRGVPLTGTQRDEARLYLESHLIDTAIGLLSVLVALSGVGLRYGLPGVIYFLLGPAHGLHRWLRARSREAPMPDPGPGA